MSRKAPKEGARPILFDFEASDATFADNEPFTANAGDNEGDYDVLS